MTIKYKTKLILDHLLEMIKLTEDEAQKYAEGLYLSNKIFADYIDLCYNRLWSSRWYSKKLPDYKCDNVGYGLHTSHLEKVFKRFQNGAFSNETNPTNLSDERMENILIQIMESVSDIEQVFLKQLLRGTYENISLEKWKELRRM